MPSPRSRPIRISKRRHLRSPEAGRWRAFIRFAKTVVTMTVVGLANTGLQERPSSTTRSRHCRQVAKGRSTSHTTSEDRHPTPHLVYGRHLSIERTAAARIIPWVPGSTALRGSEQQSWQRLRLKAAVAGNYPQKCGAKEGFEVPLPATKPLAVKNATYSWNILCEAFANSRRPLSLYPWTEIAAQRYLIVARLS